MPNSRTTIILIACAALLVAGCNIKRPRLPRVHKMTVQQGNVVTQEMIDRLKPGMTRSQVSFVMGEPIFRNSFNDNRWDYIYTIELPGVYNQEKQVSLFFHEDVLAYFTGDMIPTEDSDTEDAEVAESSEDDDADKSD